MKKWGLALAAAILLVSICGISWGAWISDVTAANSKPPTQQSEQPEQVKIFFGGIGDDEDAEKLEKKINSWLSINKGKIEVIFRTHSGSGYTNCQVMIWYKKKA